MAKAKNYDASSIDFFQGLDGIRKRADMYIGSSDSSAILGMLREIVGNSADEATNGHASKIAVALGKDGSITVADNGRGIPVGPHPKDKARDTLTILATELHAGGKMTKDGAYAKGSIGVNGVGMAVVNALSSVMTVASYRNGSWHTQTFEKGKPKTAKPVKAKKAPGPTADGKNKGTWVRFSPDPTVLQKGSKLSEKAAMTWLENISWFIPAALSVHTSDGKVKTFDHKGQLSARIWATAKADNAEIVGQRVFQTRNAGVDVAFGWATSAEPRIQSFVAGAETPQGGTHVTALMAAIHEALLAVAPKRAMKDIKVSDLEAGMIAVVNVTLTEPKFSSQEKVKLTSPEAKTMVQTALADDLLKFFKKNRTWVTEVVARLASIASTTASYKADIKLISEAKDAKKGRSTIDPRIHKVCSAKNPDDRELYIAEGLSALSSIVDARDPKFQEGFALTGKIPNLYRNAGKVATNDRIVALLRAIGFDPSSKDKSRRVGRIVLFPDFDKDGSHILALLIGFLNKVAPHLVEEGRVFTVDPSLYVYRSPTQVYYGKSLSDIKGQVRGTFDPALLLRMKGHGEAPKEILRDIAFNPKTRRLIPVLPNKDQGGRTRMLALLSDDTAARKELLGI